MLAMFQMMNFLYIAAHLLVDVKKEELQRGRSGGAPAIQKGKKSQ